MEIAVDIDRNCVRINGEVLRMTPRECEIMAIFQKYPGRVIHGDRIEVGIYGDGVDMRGAQSTIKVLISNMRKKLAPHGLEIVSYLSRGYELREVEKS